MYTHIHVRSSVGRALCLEYRVSWVQVPTRGSSFFLRKVTALGVLYYFTLIVVCLTLLASFFIPSHLSLGTSRGFDSESDEGELGFV